MDCIFQKPLTDEQLSSALDGEADTEVGEHLTQCEFCRARLSDARQFEAQLRRGVHPTTQQLTDFQAGLASGPTQRVMAAHVAYCHLCQSTLSTLVALSEDVSIPLSVDVPRRPPARQITRPTPDWGSAVRELVGHWLQPLGTGPRLAGVNVLGHHANILTAEADGLRIHVTMEAVRDGIVVSGQLVTDDEAEQAAWEGATLAVTNLDLGVRSTTFLNDLGEFTCQPLPPGQAYLRIRTDDGRALVLDDFPLGGRNGG